jgi:hypothetical protein
MVLLWHDQVFGSRVYSQHVLWWCVRPTVVDTLSIITTTPMHLLLFSSLATSCMRHRQQHADRHAGRYAADTMHQQQVATTHQHHHIGSTANCLPYCGTTAHPHHHIGSTANYQTAAPSQGLQVQCRRGHKARVTKDHRAVGVSKVLPWPCHREREARWSTWQHCTHLQRCDVIERSNRKSNPPHPNNFHVLLNPIHVGFNLTMHSVTCPCAIETHAVHVGFNSNKAVRGIQPHHLLLLLFLLLTSSCMHKKLVI